jgi:hypothetical protein
MSLPVHVFTNGLRFLSAPACATRASPVATLSDFVVPQCLTREFSAYRRYVLMLHRCIGSLLFTLTMLSLTYIPTLGQLKIGMGSFHGCWKSVFMHTGIDLVGQGGARFHAHCLQEEYEHITSVMTFLHIESYISYHIKQ